ncbi:hypothetical protein Dimus_037775, partial [Dionaea muscipula]
MVIGLRPLTDHGSCFWNLPFRTILLLVVRIRNRCDLRRGCSVRFLNCWTLHSDFHQLVDRDWNSQIREGNMDKVLDCLKRVRIGLRQLHRASFSNLTERIQEARLSLDKSQADLRQGFSDERRVLMMHQAQKLQLSVMSGGKAATAEIQGRV